MKNMSTGFARHLLSDYSRLLLPITWTFLSISAPALGADGTFDNLSVQNNASIGTPSTDGYKFKLSNGTHSNTWMNGGWMELSQFYGPAIDFKNWDGDDFDARLQLTGDDELSLLRRETAG